MGAALGTCIADSRQPQTLGHDASLCVIVRCFMIRVYPGMLHN